MLLLRFIDQSISPHLYGIIDGSKREIRRR